GIWYWYMSNHQPTNSATWYWCYGFLLTGLVLFIIGLAIGPIGRAARHAELPPPEATPDEANIQKTAATHLGVAVPLQPAAPPVAAVSNPTLPAPVAAVPPVKQQPART